MKVFKTYEDAQSAWEALKDEIRNDYDDPEEEDEDDINRATDTAFQEKYGFDINDYV